MKYYLDCECDGFGGDLISLALVGEDNRHLYLAWPKNDATEWVARNVIPIITCPGADPHIHRVSGWPGLIREFLWGDLDLMIIVDWPDNIRYFCGCLITGPGEMIATVQRLAFEIHRVDAYPTTLPGAVQHNALWDARALRHKLVGAA